MLATTSEFDIDRQGVLSSIGYADEYQPSARIASLVNDYIENYHDLIAPSYLYVIRDIKSVEGNRVDIGDSVILQSRVIARLLRRCRKVAVFALTIGSNLEEMVAHLAEDGLVLQATVLDAIGSSAAEKMAYYVENMIRKIANAEGLTISRRFSPGYCDWDLSQQKMVFRALKDDSGGVRLTEGYLMVPQKSISGIVGISLAKNHIEAYHPCDTCRKKNCPGRR